MKSYLKSIAHSLDLQNQAYSTALFVVSLGFSLLMLWLVTSYMPPAEYGVYQYVLSFMGLASITVLPGIGKMLSSYVAKGQDGVPRQVNVFTMKTGVLGIVALAGAAAYEFVFEGNARPASLIGFAALVFLPYSIFSRYEAVLGGLQRFRELLLLRTVCMGAQFLTGAVALAVFHQDYVGYGITQLAVGTLLFWQFYVFASRRLRNENTDAGAVRHAVVLSAVDAGSTLLTPALQLYVNATLGSSALALFVVAKRITEQAGGIVKPLVKPISIKLTRQGADVHTAALLRLVPLALLLGAALYGCLLVGIGVIGPIIVAPAYSESLQYAKIFGLIFLISPLYVLLRTNLVFERRSTALATAVYAEQAVRFAGYVAFVGRFGIPAIALVNVLAMGVQISLMLFFLMRYARTRPPAMPAVPLVETAGVVSFGDRGGA